MMRIYGIEFTTFVVNLTGTTVVKQQRLECISGKREIISDKLSYVKYDRAQCARNVHHMSYHQLGILE